MTATHAGNPFSTRGALALVLGGAAIFIALLWMIGAGLTHGPANDGGNHGSGKGLNGFAGMARLLESQGRDVRQSRSERALGDEGLLVLTPPHGIDPDSLDALLLQRSQRGPTLLILPKWQALPMPSSVRPAGAKEGWVSLGGTASPAWAADLRALGPLDPRIAPGGTHWSGLGMTGALPEPAAVQAIASGRIATLVRDSHGAVLAGLLDDGQDHGRISAMAGIAGERVSGGSAYPLVIVAEPDLLDNYGMGRPESAQLAVTLVEAMTDGKPMPVIFDLTLNGHARTANLLTLAFTPPFLATTLCLLLAALVIGWRAFVRFGPARVQGPAIAFGKTALVANAAGLIRRTRRLHLLTLPYAERVRERLMRALAIGRQPDPDATEASIDRALASREGNPAPFSRIAARLRAATSAHRALAAARQLHALERKLTR